MCFSVIPASMLVDPIKKEIREIMSHSFDRFVQIITEKNNNSKKISSKYCRYCGVEI